jgi:CRISPR/Cas system CSM-associated protein Csm3 (group 7 of RAMP superfamily)
MLFKLAIRLKVKAPFLTKSSEIAAQGVDAAMAENAFGKYSFPRNLIKGCLSQAWTELRDLGLSLNADPAVLLGCGSAYETGASSSVEPNRGLLVFDDFVASKDEYKKETFFRISIERDRRAAQQGAYQLIELPFAVGDEVWFAGSIQYFADNPEPIRRDIELGLRWITHLGALENVGFGRLVGVEVKDPDEVNLEPTAVPAPIGDALDLIIKPQAPFCLAKKRTSANIFESDEIISGGAMKGAFAATWLKLLGVPGGEIVSGRDLARPDLAANFSAVRFTHAFPASETNKRPTMYPYSLALGDDGALHDVARCETPVLVKKGDGKFVAPAFFMDWKDSERRLLRDAFGWAAPKTKLEVHTAIKDNSAKEGQLYAYELIVPREESDNEIEWYARVDLSAVVDAGERQRVAEQLCDLLASIDLEGIGKTKTAAKVVVRNGGTIQPYTSSEGSLLDGCWIVTLQTPALLCDPARLDETSGRQELEAAYAQAWEEISGDDKGRTTLELVRYFASQSLAGGKYLHKRFQPGKPYNPYLLTDAGSVFVLRAVAGKEAEAASFITASLRNGLPLPLWAKVRYARDSNSRDGDNWANCPYIPQNGYGEIAVNLKTHDEKYDPTVYERIESIETKREAHLNDEPSPPPPIVFQSSQPQAQAVRRFLGRWLIEGTLTTDTPLHIGNGGTINRRKLANQKTEKLVDISSVAVAGVDNDERAYLPATTIKGNLREWARACGMKDIEVFFGSDKGEDKENLRAGKIQFQDAFAIALEEQTYQFEKTNEPPYWCAKRLTGVATGVAINRRRRTASDKKLFHYEYVPPGVTFNLVLSGNDHDDSLPTSGDAGLIELLALLDGFNENGAVSLGSETSDTGPEGWGRFSWKLGSVKLLDETKVKEWIKAGGNNVGCEIAENFFVERAEELREAVELRAAMMIADAIPRHHIALNVTLSMRENFLVNDPSKSGENPLPNHTPLRDTSGRPLLPRRSIRGAMRSQAEKIIRTMGGYACYMDDLTKACKPVNSIAEARANLCLACQLFGASGWRSPFQCTPFVAVAEQIVGQPQEFVAIDRFTGGGSEGRKFNAQSFYKPELKGRLSLDLKAIAELYKGRADIGGSWVLGLLALTVRDLVEGDVRIGFGAAKGYGVFDATISNITVASNPHLPELFRAVLDEEFLSDLNEIMSLDQLSNSLSRTVLEVCLAELPKALANARQETKE